MTYAYPWAFLLPILVYVLRFTFTKTKSNIGASHRPQNIESRKSIKQIIRTPVLELISLAAILLLTIAAARPQISQRLFEQEDSRNLMLALDVSRSMSTNDFSGGGGSLQRLEAVKSVIAEFAEGRQGDRVGIVLFGSKAYLDCPLTYDTNLVVQLVNQLRVGIAGDGTAIGEGLGLALKHIKDIPGDSKAIILLTDGVNTSGSVNPLQAAKIAKDLGIKVHTIGIGSSETANRKSLSIFRPPVATYDFDEATLTAISKETGGVYFNARSLEGLKEVYEEIDNLERVEHERKSATVVREHYPRFLLAGLVLYLLYVVLQVTVLARFP